MLDKVMKKDYYVEAKLLAVVSTEKNEISYTLEVPMGYGLVKKVTVYSNSGNFPYAKIGDTIIVIFGSEYTVVDGKITPIVEGIYKQEETKEESNGK